MNKNVSFTIVAKNYIGIALALEKSIKKNNHDIDFYIFVADEFAPNDKLFLEESGISLNENVLIAKNVLDIQSNKWKELSFKYDLTEFCTAIKSKCFTYLLNEKKYDKAIFFDPDILVFSKLDLLFEELDRFSIILTPHLLDINASSETLDDNDMMNTGVFNLGFIALRNSGVNTQMLQWWNIRLFECCYIDYYEGYFTDQKWANFIPGYFDRNEVLIIDHPGMNVAPWNFGERELLAKEGEYHIKYRKKKNGSFPLVFVHYSGFDYQELILGNIEHKTIRKLKIYDDLLPLFDEYKISLRESDFTKYLKMEYSYSFFENSAQILNIHRRLYRRLVDDNIHFSEPFEIAEGSFFDILKNKKMVSSPSKSIAKSNRFNTPNIGGKVKLINILLRFIYKVIGYQRYFMLVKLMREYSKVENHVHLIQDTYLTNNVFSEK